MEESALRCAERTVCGPQADPRYTERLFGQQHPNALLELPQHHLVRPPGCPSASPTSAGPSALGTVQRGLTSRA